MATPSEVASRITGALTVSEPELDTSVGTPIRKIIDTVAEAISETTVESFLQTYQYDIDTRSGADLDSFAALFGFFRLQARKSNGAILLQRTTTAPESVVIPSGAQASTGGTAPIVVRTIVPAVFPRGNTVLEIPVETIAGGSAGDIGAGQIIRWLSAVEGITSITNPAALTGGADVETDEQFRERIKKTIFRNLAGTKDMYLGVGLGQKDTEQSEVYGPFERWTERIEIINGVGSPALADMPWVNVMESCQIPNTADTTPKPGIVDTDQAHNLFTGDYVFISDSTGAGNDVVWEGLRRVSNVYSSTQVQFEGDDGLAIVGGANTGTVTIRRILRMSGSLDRSYTFGNNIDRNDVFSRTAYSVDFAQVPPVITVQDTFLIPDGVYEFSFIYNSQGSRNRPFRTANIISDRVDTWIDGVTQEQALTVSVLDGNNTMDFDSFYTMGSYKRRDGSRPETSSIVLPLPFKPVVSAPNALSLGEVDLLLGVDYFIVDWMPEDETGSMEGFSGLEFLTTDPQITSGAQAATWNVGTSPVQINFSGTPFAQGQRVLIEGTSESTLNGNAYFLIDTGGGQLALTGTPTLSPSGGTARLYHPVSTEYVFNAAPYQAQRDVEEWRMLGQDTLVHHATPVPLSINVAVILQHGFGLNAVQQGMDYAATRVLRSVGIGGTLQISDLLNALGDVTGVDAVRMLTGSDVPYYTVTGCSNASPGATLTIGAHSFGVGDYAAVSFVNTTNPGVNGFWRVSAAGATTITLEDAADGSGFVADGDGVVSEVDYAIRRMSRDGSRPEALYSNRDTNPARAIDIPANSNEQFILNAVNVSVKAQNTWRVAN